MFSIVFPGDRPATGKFRAVIRPQLFTQDSYRMPVIMLLPEKQSASS